jgi:ribonuclease-3
MTPGMTDSRDAVDLETLVGRLGYSFHDPGLLERALVHRSYVNEHHETPGHNERLEFLGDAVLDLVIAETLMERLPDSAEGELTRRRAALVNEGSLADVAADLDLGVFLCLGRGEELNNGRERPSILADAVEALMGAIYLDGGYDAARTAALGWFEDRLEDVVAGRSPADPKTVLQERLQARGSGSPTYRVVTSTGPDHDPVFEVEVVVDGNVIGRGTGRSKKDAEKDAARWCLALARRDPAAAPEEE